jgi:hypothetical protein
MKNHSDVDKKVVINQVGHRMTKMVTLQSASYTAVSTFQCSQHMLLLIHE